MDMVLNFQPKEDRLMFWVNLHIRPLYFIQLIAIDLVQS